MLFSYSAKIGLLAGTESGGAYDPPKALNVSPLHSLPFWNVIGAG